MVVKLLRNGLGQVIIFADWITRPKPVVRAPEQQRLVNEQASNLALYQYAACPFCVKVRRKMHQLNLPIPLKDAKNDRVARQELLEQGGKTQVPCLRIQEDEQVSWLYESAAINEYLEQQFS